jgi:hypothetical protein
MDRKKNINADIPHKNECVGRRQTERSTNRSGNRDRKIEATITPQY